MPRPIAAPLLLVVALAASGCTPSYRFDEIPSSIRHICETEYHLSVQTKLVGRTLAVNLVHPGILFQESGQVGLSSEANEILGNVIEATHRVILSADQAVNFYLLLISDPNVPGAYLTLIRYLDDVRRVNANMLTPTEFFSRTILDLKYLGVPDMTLNQLVFSDISLEQFLSWQLARRIQGRLAEQLQSHGIPTADVGQVVGEFKDGEFAFTLNVTPKPGLPFDPAVVDQVFSDASQVIAEVLEHYQFEQFEAVRLVHPPTGVTKLMPKSGLESFRKVP